MDIKLSLLYSGKVRDVYSIDKTTILIIASDRVSAFDVVFPEKIQNKGKILTKIANFWFDNTRHIIKNHLVNRDLISIVGEKVATKIKDRSVVVKKIKPLLVEAIVRGYLFGSAWHNYKKNGSVGDIKLSANLQLAEQLAEPIYTPSTKAALGAHDENISYKQSEKIVGKKIAQQIKDISLKLYSFAYQRAYKRGIIIADTKFEFGLDDNNDLVLIDEILTPDSSRFLDKNQYKAGCIESFDKQIIRDYLIKINWDAKTSPPKLPESIINKTAKKYQQIADILCN